MLSSEARPQPDASGADAANRPPPEVICLPPWLARGQVFGWGASVPGQRAALVVLLVCAGVMVAVATLLLFWVRAIPGIRWAVGSLYGVAVLNLLLCGVLSLLFRRQRHRWKRREEAYGQRHPDWKAHPLASRLAERFAKAASLYRPDGLRPDKLRAILDELEPEASAAHVLCVGLDPPPIGDYRFEPVVVSATDWMWRQLWFVPVAVVLLGVWQLGVVHVLPFRLPLSSFGYFLTMGVMMAGLWVWRTALRPTYLRLAPGMVQVLRYGLGARRPEVQSYPLSRGTLAVVSGLPETERINWLTLARGEHKVAIPVWQMKDRDQVSEALWRALLSTAPTPPLSDEALTG